MGLGRFDEAKVCYESLRSRQECTHQSYSDKPTACYISKQSLGGDVLAEKYLKKLHDAQERIENYLQII